MLVLVLTCQFEKCTSVSNRRSPPKSRRFAYKGCVFTWGHLCSSDQPVPLLSFWAQSIALKIDPLSLSSLTSTGTSKEKPAIKIFCSADLKIWLKAGVEFPVHTVVEWEHSTGIRGLGCWNDSLCCFLLWPSSLQSCALVWSQRCKVITRAEQNLLRYQGGSLAFHIGRLLSISSCCKQLPYKCERFKQFFLWFVLWILMNSDSYFLP